MALLERFPKKIPIFKPIQPQIMFQGKIEIQELIDFIVGLLKTKGFLVSISKYKLKGAIEKLKELEMKIEGERTEFEFIMYSIKIEIRVESGKVIEKEEKNLYKTVKSQIEIKLSSSMELDYDNKYDENSKIKDILGRIYWLFMKKYILRNRADAFWYECLGIIESIKNKLNAELTKTSY